MRHKANPSDLTKDKVSQEDVVHAVAIPGGQFCTVSRIPQYTYAFWIPILSFECLLCTLAIMKGIQHFKMDGSYYYTGVRLVDILVQDSILYFAA